MSTLSPIRLKSRLYSWPVIAAVILLTQAVISMTASNSEPWIRAVNFVLLLLLLLATGISFQNAMRSTQTVRLFWVFLTGALAIWALNPMTWLYSTVFQGQQAEPFRLLTSFLFLHIVLLIAAVASSPHLKSSSQKPYRVTLNFFLLLLSWVFVYAYGMYPYHQAAVPTVLLRFQAFYMTENLVLLAILGTLVFRTEGPWKSMYMHLFGASVLYALSSLAGNIRYAWKGGSAGPIHIPILASACWFVWVGLRGRQQLPQLAETVRADERETKYSSLLAWLAV